MYAFRAEGKQTDAITFATVVKMNKTKLADVYKNVLHSCTFVDNFCRTWKIEKYS